MWMIVLLYMLLATTFTLGKAVLCFIDPIFFVGIRMILGGFLLLLYYVFILGKQIRFQRKDLWLFIQVVLFHIYLSFSFEFWALTKVSSAKAALLFNFAPFITALLSFFLFHELLSVKQWLGLCVGFAGLFPWIITESPGEYSNIFLSFSKAELALLLGVTSASYGWILVKQLVRHDSYSPLFVNGFAMFFGGILALGTSFVLEGSPHLMYTAQLCPTDAPGVAFFTSKLGVYWAQVLLIALYMVLLIIITNIICYNLYGHLLKRYTATFLSFAGFTCPIFAALFGWIYLGETITTGFIISLLTVFLGLYLFVQDEFIKKRPSL